MKLSAPEKAGFKRMPDSIAGLVLRAVVVSSVFWYSALALPGLDDKLSAAASLITLSGILIGFLMTAISLLISSADKLFIVSLRKTGHFQRLVKDLVNSAIFWVAVIFLSLLCHLVKDFDLVLSAALSAMVYSLIYFVSAMNELKVVINTLSIPD